MNKYVNKSIAELLTIMPFLSDWLKEYNFLYDEQKSFFDNLSQCDKSYFWETRLTPEELAARFTEYVDGVTEFLNLEQDSFNCITILPGKDKNGNSEGFSELTIKKGSVVAIIGQTGSGKSRLLADVEWGANGDTPTGRRVLLDGLPMKRGDIGKGNRRIIAQLSQKMSFVLDMSVREFLELHTQCWRGIHQENAVEKTYEMAVALSGEPFSLDAQITGLSGGQTRALMIADCAILSSAPIMLIDEIENAGINRREALKLLSGEDKIVLIATHDPVLTLLADYRVVIKNGGISEILVKTPDEEAALQAAEAMDLKLTDMCNKLRLGLRL